MTPDLDIRRSIRRIARADLAHYPVWEWALHEEETISNGESFVRPTALDSISTEGATQFVVSATVTLSNGTELPACAEVAIRAGKARAEPMFFFLGDRHLDFAGPETLTTLAHFTKSAQVRPVRWVLDVPLAGSNAKLGGKVRSGLLATLAGLLRRTPARGFAWVKV